MKHYQEKLSAHLHDELPPSERQRIDEHLSRCVVCRAEYDEIKFGARLAKTLAQTDAPRNVWNKIENNLSDEKRPSFSFFKSSVLIPAAFAVLVALGISILVYSFFWRKNSIEVVENQPLTNQPAKKSSNEWNVETISGVPKTDNQTIARKGNLTVGETLETDENSRAKVEVADIGQVEIAPNSRVQLVKIEAAEHRLSLEKGVLKAQIFAPPRLFIVDTPSAVAVDLGCAYTLEVADNGDSKLHVTSGFVALERDGRESIVPAGAMALTKKNAGLGTPFAEDAAPVFRKALYQFDFENGGSESLRTILKNSNAKTSLTLWHLLSRVSENDREKVFNKIISVVKLPDGATKDGVLKLNEEMLEAWRSAVEEKWFQVLYQ